MTFRIPSRTRYFQSPNFIEKSLTYHYNAEEVSWNTYQNELKAVGVLVKARNFLVFQGDVEAIASKTPE